MDEGKGKTDKWGCTNFQSDVIPSVIDWFKARVTCINVLTISWFNRCEIVILPKQISLKPLSSETPLLQSKHLFQKYICISPYSAIFTIKKRFLLPIFSRQNIVKKCPFSVKFSKWNFDNYYTFWGWFTAVGLCTSVNCIIQKYIKAQR